MYLTLRQLLYFVSSVDARSITRAAEDLHVAPTALSQQIKLLEDHIGTPLLDRHSRGIKPTEAGKELYLKARGILDQVAETEAMLLRLEKRPQRLMTVGMAPALARLVGPDAVMGMEPRFADMRLGITEGWSDDLFERMQAGELHFVLGYDLPEHPDIIRVDLAHEHLFFASAAGRWPGTGPVALTEVLQRGLTFYGRRSVSWRMLQQAAGAIGATLDVVQEVTSMEVWRALVVQGVADTVAPYGALVSELAAGTVVAHEIVGGAVQVRVMLAGRQEVFRTGIRSGFVPFLAAAVQRRYSAADHRFVSVLAPPDWATLAE